MSAKEWRGLPLVQPVGVPLTEEDALKMASRFLKAHGPWNTAHLSAPALAQILLSVDVASREQAQREAREVLEKVQAALWLADKFVLNAPFDGALVAWERINQARQTVESYLA